MARDLVQERVASDHRLPQGQLETSEILLADGEVEGVRAAHQVRHLTPKGQEADSLVPDPIARSHLSSFSVSIVLDLVCSTDLSVRSQAGGEHVHLVLPD